MKRWIFLLAFVPSLVLAGNLRRIQTTLDQKDSTSLNINFDKISNDLLNKQGKLNSASLITVGSITASTVTFTSATVTNATISNLVNGIMNYRRPVLRYISATTVDVENNTGTLNETKIIFPDGNIRSVTEDTASTSKYRRFIITENAEFRTGTENSGMQGVTESVNTWYAIYAVKSLVDSTKFVLAGSTLAPIQANFSLLDSTFSANGWAYIGLIRNGDNAGTTGNILEFYQSGNMTLFANNTTGGAVLQTPGTLLASVGSAASLTYSYSVGMGTTQIPGNIFITRISGFGTSETIYISAGTDGSKKRLFHHHDATSQTAGTTLWCEIVNGLAIGAGATSPFDIFLTGFIDGALGVGANPQL